MKNEFPGTDVEKLALFRAVNNNCGCTTSPEGVKTFQSGCHDLLSPTPDSQAKWKRLIFMRRNAGKLLVQELAPQHKVHKAPVYTPHAINMMHRLGAR